MSKTSLLIGCVLAAALHGLLWLELRATQVTDAGLAHLRGMKRLVHVDLGLTQITDAGLAHLEMTKLRRINLAGTRVTEEGVKALKRALPKTEIVR